VPDPILAASDWPTNAALIADCAKLNYIRVNDKVLDPTYGRGLWWTDYRPEHLTERDRKTHPEWDFRKMDEFADATFHCVAFDPPYVAQGGRKTIGAKAQDFADRFGMVDCAPTPPTVQADIEAGMRASYRVLKRRGRLLMKCKSYISGGKFFPGVHYCVVAGWETGFLLVDEVVHLAGTGPQPGKNLDGSTRRQAHFRSNFSTMLVFRKP